MEELLSREIKLIESLSNYSIEFGILQEDSYKKVEVNVLNTDGTITKVGMNLCDVMYLTENGTMTLPAQHILDKVLNYCDNKINRYIEEIIENIFNDDKYNDTQISAKLNILCMDIQNYASLVVSQIIKSNNTLGSILQQKDGNKYLYDLNKLKNFIKCRLIKK